MLFTIYSILQRSQDERRWLKEQAEATVRAAVALEAIVAKLNEPAPDPPPGDQQPDVDALVAKLATSNQTLADEVAKILAANP